MFQCVSDIKEGMDESLASSLCTPSDGRTHGLYHGSGAEHDTGEILSCTRFPEHASYSSVNTFYSISSLEVALRGMDHAALFISIKCLYHDTIDQINKGDPQLIVSVSYLSQSHHYGNIVTLLVTIVTVLVTIVTHSHH